MLPETFIRSDAMRSLSAVASITFHVGLAAAVLFGTARTGRSSPAHREPPLLVFPAPLTPGHDRGGGLSVPIPAGPDGPVIPVIPLPKSLLQREVSVHPAFPTTWTSSATPSSGSPDGNWVAPLGENGPVVLTGPLPTYPELLRQAGIQGRVVLEAVVDTTGRVSAASILVVSATHPGFVAPARQALAATLFRPARVGARAVRMRVRVPFEFTIRGGTGRAR